MSLLSPKLPIVLIMGADGWIGSAICRYVRSRDVNVLALRLGDADRESTLEYVRSQLQPGPVVLINAARSHRGGVGEAARAVQEGLDAARSLEARYLHIGSAAEYGNYEFPIDEELPLNPLTDYGRLKASESRLVIDARQSHGVETCVLRPFTILGPHPRVGTLFHDITARVQAAKADGGACYLDQGSFERDFIGLDLLCEAVWRVMQYERIPVALNVCSGSAHTIHELATAVCKQFGRECEVVDTRIGTGIPSVVGSPDLMDKVLKLRENRSLSEIVASTF